MNQTKLESMALTKYFGLQAVLNKDAEGRRALFADLADVYRISPDKADELFALTEREEISCIDTYETYCIHSRAMDYRNKFTSVPMTLPEDLLLAFRCKGKALRELTPLLRECKNDFSERQLKFCLEKEELTYPIAVSFLFSYLFFTGSILPKDVARGKKFGERCLRWNDVNGILLLLRHGDRQKKNRYLSALMTLISESDCAEDYLSVLKSYHTGDNLYFCAETMAIMRYHRKNPETRESYDPAVADFAASSLIVKDDRLRLLDVKGSNAAAFSEFFVAEKTDLFAPNKRLNAYLSESRKTECDQIEVCLKMQGSDMIKTPVIVTGDVAVKEGYFSALKQLAATEDDLMRIDVASAVKAPFYQGKNNDVVKLLLRKKVSGGLFFICDVDELTNDQAADLSALLESGNRQHYFLNDVGISLDLSGCLFVLTSSGSNIPTPLKKQCQIINVAEATKEEKKAYVRSLIGRYTAIYDCKAIAFSEEAEEHLCDCDSSVVSLLIERVCLSHNGEKEKVSIGKPDLIGKYADDRRMTFHIHAR